LDSQTLEKHSSEDNQKSTEKAEGRWTLEEHNKFLEAVKLYGKNWKQMEQFIITRNAAQIRSHAQKYYARCKKSELMLLEKSSTVSENLETGNSTLMSPKSAKNEKITQNELKTAESTPILEPERKTKPNVEAPKFCYPLITQLYKVDIFSSIDRLMVFSSPLRKAQEFISIPESLNTDLFEQNLESEKITCRPRKYSDSYESQIELNKNCEQFIDFPIEKIKPLDLENECFQEPKRKNRGNSDKMLLADFSGVIP